MFPLFDAHCDTAFAVMERGCALRKNSCHTDLERGGAFSPRGQVYAVWQYGEGLTPEELTARFWRTLENLRRELDENSGLVRLCTGSAGIREAFAAGKQAALISVEGAGLFGCTEAGLERAFGMGVRIVHLCWNDSNALCGAAADGGGGLTGRGRDFVRQAAGMGAVIDLSHASDAAVRDVLEMGCAHVLASHSNCRALCDVPRNLPDELLRGIAEAGGVVGLNLYPPFLGGPSLQAAAAHAVHLLEVCGGDRVCLGCDLDGVTELPEGERGIEDMPALRAALAAGGLAEETLDAVFFGNLMSFWERCL